MNCIHVNQATMASTANNGLFSRISCSIAAGQRHNFKARISTTNTLALSSKVLKHYDACRSSTGSTFQQDHRQSSKSSHPSPIRSVMMAPRELQQGSTDEDVTNFTGAAENSKLCFLLVCDAFNSMAQRSCLKLQESGHQVVVHIFKDGEAMITAAAQLNPDVILCPFLTKRIPAAIYTGNTPCLVIHPGIEGDRGMSSIDWALQEGQPEWGVTILQAEEEMDAGPIWATSNFPIHRHLGGSPTKSSLYRIECVNAAMRCIDELLHNLNQNVPPRPLDYTNPAVKGTLRPRLLQSNRHLDWNLPAHELATIIRASDSQPGTLSTVANEKYLLFGAHVESNPPKNMAESSAPMDILGQRDGAILIRCGEGTALWITHLKKSVKSVKVPALMALPSEVVASLPHLKSLGLALPMMSWPQTFQEIFYWTENDVTYLWFDFYNGAMSTPQCQRLAQALDHLEAVCDSKVLVLMGGINYFSNGIHLNTIEAAQDPAQESWENINAIDDVVQRILTSSKRVTVSAFLGNAGAGGVMAAAAADHVWAHGNVVLHPSYKPMELYGSEYWTYSLPKRVGYEVASQLVESTNPVSALQARKYGLVDDVLCPSSVGFVERVIERAELLAQGRQCQEKIAQKQRALPSLQWRLQQHRHHELVEMRACFVSEVYHRKRREFVFKSAGNLPCQVELTKPPGVIKATSQGVAAAMTTLNVEDRQMTTGRSFMSTRAWKFSV